MYKIIGGDGKEYGPASADQVREWVRQGRANDQTQVRPENDPIWRPLGGLAEFAGVPDAGPLPQPPALEAAPIDADAILAREPRLDIGACLSRGWGLMRRHFWLTAGTVSLAFVMQIVVELVPLLGWMAVTVLAMVLWGGVDWLLLKLARGQPACFGDMFSGFSTAFMPLMLLSVITMTLTPMGLLLCVLPGIYLMAIWTLFPALLIMDRKMDFWPAMELSRQVVHKCFWPVIGLAVVCLLLFLAGLLCVGIGVFVTLPWTSAAVIYAYEDLFGP